MKKLIELVLVLFIVFHYSSNAQVNIEANKNQGIIHFTVNVNTVFPDCKGITLALQDSEKMVQDNGVLMLPESYS